MRRINEIIYAGAFIRQVDKANLFGLIPLNFKRDILMLLLSFILIFHLMQFSGY